jgi:anthraniloyl-CoA monooxygenase
MKVEVLGGGPAGLFSAILIKKSWPNARIHVFEQNRPDDTFGFGIVLSDETLNNIRRADEETYAAFAAEYAYWDDIYVHYKGTVERSGGHGFSGLQRLAMLRALQNRAEALGVEISYGTRAPTVGEASQRADLVIASDGINSAARDAWKDRFQPSLDLRPNRFTWLGAQWQLPGFTYAFSENQHGIWNMHAYMFTRPGVAPLSTIVFETTDAAYQSAGLETENEAKTAAWCEEVFADVLQGNKVLTNRSYWRNFPTVKCARWGADNVVLMGDAAHTAHYSIGSGTKLALEDAIAFHASLTRNPARFEDAVKDYEVTRREEVDKTQHSAQVSLGWFENVRRFWNMPQAQFHFSVMSRSKAITYENMRLRDSHSVEQLTQWWNDGIAAQYPDLPAPKPNRPPMFSPLKLRGMTLKNRVVISPMAQYMAVDGAPTDWHLMHYGARAVGGAGMVFTEMTCPSADARITPGCTGLYNDAHTAAWKRIVDFIHSSSDAKICMQIGHAGRKGSTQVGWEKMDHPLPQGNWPLMSASAIAYMDGINAVPREMTRDDMNRVRDDFVAAARRADAAGFDMLELHAAHGYLLASFISPITNKRTDEYGGSLQARLKYPLEVWDAVRAVWPAAKPMSVRVSATDWIEGGVTGADTVEIARHFKAHGADLIDVSSGQTDPASKPVYGRMFQAGFAEQVRFEAGIATMAVGAITSADQINTLVISGRADLVALGRPHLADPAFTLKAAADYDVRDAGWPRQYLAGAQQAHTLAIRAKTDQAAREARLVAAALSGKSAESSADAV